MDEILLNSLQSSMISIPSNVSSIRDLTPSSLFSISAQALNLMNHETKPPYSTSLPDSMADQFKICTQIASAIQDFGYIGDMSFHKFLYPSEEDLYKLIRFFVERLSEASDGRSKALEDGDARKELNAESYQVDPDKSDLTLQKVESELNDLKIVSEEAKSSDLSISRPSNSRLFEQSMGEVAMDTAASSRKQNFSNHELVTTSKGTENEASGNEVVTPQGNDGQTSIFRHDATSHIPQTCEIRSETQQCQDQESKQVEEVSANDSELKHLQMELEMLKAAAQHAFGDNHPIDVHLQQLDEQINSRKLLAMKSQWDAERELLEKKRRSLQELLCANNPEALEKLQKLRDVELEMESIKSEIKRRKEEHSKLSTDLEKQPKQASRRSYIDRVKEITKNSRKQDADINRILKETRGLQLESNTVQERLHRTYAVVDELVLREVKKDAVGRQVYKLLTSIHENFEQISDKLLATDRLRREIAEHEKKIAALSSRSLNFDKLQADLDAITRENEYLEQNLHHKN